MDDLSSLENLEIKRQLSFLESPRGSDWPRYLLLSNTGKDSRNRRKSAVSGDRSIQKNYHSSKKNEKCIEFDKENEQFNAIIHNNVPRHSSSKRLSPKL